MNSNYYGKEQPIYASASGTIIELKNDYTTKNVENDWYYKSFSTIIIDLLLVLLMHDKQIEYENVYA